MKYFDLTVEAGKIFEPTMTVDSLLIKLGLANHKNTVEEETNLLYEILKVYDNPIEVKKLVEDKIKANGEDLKNRGLVEKSPLILV